MFLVFVLFFLNCMGLFTAQNRGEREKAGEAMHAQEGITTTTQNNVVERGEENIQTYARKSMCSSV